MQRYLPIVPKQGTNNIFLKKMVKLIIFDLDGTLLDTLDDIAGACNHALEMCGCSHRTIDEYRQLVGRGISNLFRGALPQDNRSDEMVELMRSHFLPYYKEHICDLTRPYNGIVEMLDTLSKAGILFAVASNKYQYGTELLVEKTLGKERFVTILGQREGCPIKPDPQIIEDAMASIPGIRKEEVIYCGDSDVDMQTGANAGIRTIGVCWGFRGRKELEEYNPFLMVESPEEISGFMLNECK